MVLDNRPSRPSTSSQITRYWLRSRQHSATQRTMQRKWPWRWHGSVATSLTRWHDFHVQPREPNRLIFIAFKIITMSPFFPYEHLRKKVLNKEYTCERNALFYYKDKFKVCLGTYRKGRPIKHWVTHRLIRTPIIRSNSADPFDFELNKGHCVI